MFRKTDNHTEYAHAKYLKGWQLQRLGNLVDAKDVLTEAYAAFLRAEDLNGCALSLHLQAIVCHHLGQGDVAIEYQLNSINVYGKAGDEIKANRGSMSLALIFFRLGRFKEARKQYKIVEQSLSTLSKQNKISYYLGHSVLSIYSGDTEQAEKDFAFVKKNIGDLKREEAIYYEYLGWAKLLEKDYKAAETALNTGLKLSLTMGDSTTLISQTKRLLADVYVATNRHKLAEQTALESLQVAEKIGERLEIAASWRVLAQTATVLGNKQEAVEYFRKAIDLFNQIGYRFELALTRFLAARSGLYTEAESSVLLHMAEEYFASEELTEHTKLIDQAATKLIPTPKTECKAGAASSYVVLAESKRMKKVMSLVDKAAPTSFTILLTGKSGTGKDLIARYMHEQSGRTGNFVSFNAASVQPTLAESVLFGTVKGVFTDATDRPGLFEAADKGTFFLNEIGNASLELQAKLLDVLETHSFCRVGENIPRSVNFRLIAATNADLEAMIRANTFRADLYHRLRQVPVHLPSLDERKEDIPALIARFFTEQNRTMSDSELIQLSAVLSERPWQGNIRELRSELDIIWIACAGDFDRLLKEAERRVKIQQYKQAVEDADGNCSKAARLLETDESTLRYWMSKQEVDTN